MALPIAPIPFPPKDYDQQYLNELIRTLNLYFLLLQNPGPATISTLTMTHIPTSSAGLHSGAVWVDTGAGNVLKVVP